MPGLFLSFDGMDGAGKSTQVRLLQSHLEKEGLKTLLLRDPGGTPLGESLREILLHRQEIPLCMTAEMMLYMASRAQLVSSVIEPALDAEMVVICDRFLLANVVYQGSAGGLDPQTIWDVGRVATNGLAPDWTFVFDLDVQVAMSRIERGLDRLESRGVEYFERVRTGYREQANHLAGRYTYIDATQSIEKIHALIVEVVQKLIS